MIDNIKDLLNENENSRWKTGYVDSNRCRTIFDLVAITKSISFLTVPLGAFHVHFLLSGFSKNVFMIFNLFRKANSMVTCPLWFLSPNPKRPIFVLPGYLWPSLALKSPRTIVLLPLQWFSIVVENWSKNSSITSSLYEDVGAYAWLSFILHFLFNLTETKEILSLIPLNSMTLPAKVLCTRNPTPACYCHSRHDRTSVPITEGS